MKKRLCILFAITILFVFLVNVKADYTCAYESAEELDSFGTKVTGSFIVTEKNEIEASLAEGIIDKSLDSDLTDEELVDELKGMCPSEVYVCRLYVGMGTGTILNYLMLNSSLIDNYDELKEFGITKENCYVGKYLENGSTAPSSDSLFRCEKYNELKYELKKNYCNPNDKECSVSKISLYKKTKDRLKTYCKSVLKNGDYINPCVKKCSNLAKDIAKIEKTSITSGECSFSQRLLNFILNIVKWIKYIIPAIVIILGIIDFIRAIASDKDDDMKKAQGRFIKRLIAAALIFIVPFIIEFILDKMGFVAEGCGIIDF